MGSPQPDILHHAVSTWQGDVHLGTSPDLAPGGGCEVLFSPGLSVCVCVCVCPANCDFVYFISQYFGILFLGY